LPKFIYATLQHSIWWQKSELTLAFFNFYVGFVIINLKFTFNRVKAGTCQAITLRSFCGASAARMLNLWSSSTTSTTDISQVVQH